MKHNRVGLSLGLLAKSFEWIQAERVLGDLSSMERIEFSLHFQLPIRYVFTSQSFQLSPVTRKVFSFKLFALICQHQVYIKHVFQQA